MRNASRSEEMCRQLLGVVDQGRKIHFGILHRLPLRTVGVLPDGLPSDRQHCDSLPDRGSLLQPSLVNRLRRKLFVASNDQHHRLHRIRSS